MENVLTRKLEAIGRLSDEDKRVLDKVIRPSRHVPPRTDLISEGDRPGDVHLILEGFACRYKILPGGARQIVAYLLPGDFCDPHVFILKQMDHCIGTLSACQVVDIPHQHFLELAERPAIGRALWWATLVDEGTLREWLVNIGQREATKRIAHLLCELLVRLRAVGHNEGTAYTLPITQVDLADTLALSSVHVNRSLQALREKSLITWKKKELVILDLIRLFEYSDFNPNYLHLDGVVPKAAKPTA